MFWILIKHKLITSYNGDILCVFSPQKKKKSVFIFVKNTKKKIEIHDCFSFFFKKKIYIFSQRLWNATPNNYMIRRKIVSLHIELIGKVIKVKTEGWSFQFLGKVEQPPDTIFGAIYRIVINDVTCRTMTWRRTKNFV